MDILTPTNIVFAIAVMSTIFAIYSYFRNPQIENEKKDIVLAQQTQWNIESTDRRFKEIQESFKDLLLQSNNHIHTVEMKVDQLGCTVSNMSNEVTKLATIIDERIPKK